MGVQRLFPKFGLVGPGVRPGQWDLHVIVTRGKDRHISTHRLWIAPATGEAGAKSGETE